MLFSFLKGNFWGDAYAKAKRAMQQGPPCCCGERVSLTMFPLDMFPPEWSLGSGNQL